jgi:hypothetical protein
MVSILVKACYVTFRELLAGEKQRTGQIDTHPGAVIPKVRFFCKEVTVGWTGFSPLS